MSHRSHRATGSGRIVTPLPVPDGGPAGLADQQLRHNLRQATHTIRDKRLRVVGEVPDWEQLRVAGAAIKDDVLARLPELLEQFEAAATAAGATVHWARDAAEACAVVAGLVRATGAAEVVKVKSMATQEIGLNEALEAAGIHAVETDLAELIVQLAEDTPSHILVPAIHYNRDPDPRHLRAADARGRRGRSDRRPAGAGRGGPAAPAVAGSCPPGSRISGANFAIADTGTLVVVESEGNGRMCLTLPETLISVVGVEKLLPTFRDLEVFLQLLPRSSTGERMNPYTSLWTGVTPGDGPQTCTSCWSTTAAPTRSPTRSAGRRCAASAARRASTSARCTSGWAGTRTGRCTRARSARSCRRR